MKKRINSGFVLAALSLALLGVTACANLQPPPPAPPPAPEEIHAEMLLSGMVLSIYHPDTRTMYVWWGDPRPVATRPMNCIEMQLSATPNGRPKSSSCQ